MWWTSKCVFVYSLCCVARRCCVLVWWMTTIRVTITVTVTPCWLLHMQWCMCAYKQLSHTFHWACWKSRLLLLSSSYNWFFPFAAFLSHLLIVALFSTSQTDARQTSHSRSHPFNCYLYSVPWKRYCTPYVCVRFPILHLCIRYERVLLSTIDSIYVFVFIYDIENNCVLIGTLCVREFSCMCVRVCVCMCKCERDVPI